MGHSTLAYLFTALLDFGQMPEMLLIFDRIKCECNCCDLRTLLKFKSEYKTEPCGSRKVLANILLGERSTCDAGGRGIGLQGFEDVIEQTTFSQTFKVSV